MTPRALVDELNANDEAIYDAWSALDYKIATSRSTGRTSQLAPDWTAPHRRRLTYYNICRAYLSNAARRTLEVTGATPEEVADSEERRQQWREYGDSETIRDAILDALLGDGQEIVVEGAEDFDPEAEADPEDPDSQPDADAAAAFALQEFLREWASTDGFWLKLIETETNAVGLGDGVYTLGWSPEKKRVRMRCWDPSFYFPVLEEAMAEDDFPRRVHIAYEIEDDTEQNRTLVRRITWQLGPIGAESEEVIERWRQTGEIPPNTESRTLPYSDEATQITCYMTDATFEIESDRRSIDDFSLARATFNEDAEGEIRLRDLRIDFVPVVHVPNTVALLEHFGRSSIAIVMQVLDELMAADTDISGASAMTGFPPVAVTGANLRGEAKYRPGTVWNMPDGGRMDVLDTSRSLDALLKYIESLLKRLSTNAKVPEAWLGRVKPSEVPSGIALRLGFGPLERMCRKMRFVREWKYPLLFKFLWRMSLAGQAEDVPKVYAPTSLAFGQIVPSDVAGVVELITQLRGTDPPAISLETAIRWLIEAGLSIDDAAEEIARIEERDFDGASKLLDATGDEGAVFDYLGRQPTTAPGFPAPPEPVLPLAPGGS